MTFNESNILRNRGQFAGVIHSEPEGGTGILYAAGGTPVNLDNFKGAGLDGAEFPTGADTAVSGEEGFVVGAADGDGRYHWNGNDSGRDWVRLHQMKFSEDDRPGPEAYAHSLMHAGMDFNRDPEENCDDVMTAGREFYRSVDPQSLDRYSRDTYDRLGFDVEESGPSDPATSRRILGTANELVGEMRSSGALFTPRR